MDDRRSEGELRRHAGHRGPEREDDGPRPDGRVADGHGVAPFTTFLDSRRLAPEHGVGQGFGQIAAEVAEEARAREPEQARVHLGEAPQRRRREVVYTMNLGLAAAAPRVLLQGRFRKEIGVRPGRRPQERNI